MWVADIYLHEDEDGLAVAAFAGHSHGLDAYSEIGDGFIAVSEHRLSVTAMYQI